MPHELLLETDADLAPCITDCRNALYDHVGRTDLHDPTLYQLPGQGQKGPT